MTTAEFVDASAPRFWEHDADGTLRPPADMHGHPIDPAVTRLQVDHSGRVYVPDEGWCSWTLGEADHFARRLHAMHLPVRGLGRSRCTCGTVPFTGCAAAAWVRTWVAFSIDVERRICPPTAPARGGLECVMRLHDIGTDVRMVVGCDGVAHIGPLRLRAVDQRLRRDIVTLRGLHQPVEAPARIRTGGSRYSCLSQGICYGCARAYLPTWSVRLCPWQWTRAWLGVPGWWGACVGLPCHRWPAATPPHQCTQKHTGQQP